MRAPTAVLKALTPPVAFACVKVRAPADLVLAALAPIAYGMPRDLQPTIRGAALPADGRDLGRRGVLYQLERDPWSTILREGDSVSSFDLALARRLSRSLSTRAVALLVDPAGTLAYDVFESGRARASFLGLEGQPPEVEGAIDPALVALEPASHARAFLAKEELANDRVAFRQFELPGALRGRWDLAFERAFLVPELLPVADERLEPVRARPDEPPAPRRGLTREGERAVHELLLGVIEACPRFAGADTTRGAP